RCSDMATANSVSPTSRRQIRPPVELPTFGKLLEFSTGGSMGVPMSVVPLRAATTSDHAGSAGEIRHDEAEASAEAGHRYTTLTVPAAKGATARPGSGDRGVRHMSLGAKLALMVAVFLAVPVILYQQFQQADREKSQLLLESVREQGRIIAAGLAPILSRDR